MSRYCNAGKFSTFKKTRSLTHLVFPVCLSDSVLAFHDHGLQGRSFRTDEVTQEISDTSRLYRVLGSDETVILESRLVGSSSSDSDIYILTGHENTM